MKKLITLLLWVQIPILLFCQTPQMVNYQAVVRDNSGIISSNTPLKFRFSIHENSASGPIAYNEIHSTSTDPFGLVNLQIGTGTPQISNTSFSQIRWDDNYYWLQIEFQELPNVQWINMGAQQLFSVPYALHAKTVEQDSVIDDDSDPTNEIQNLNLNGNDLAITNGNSVTLPTITDTDHQNLVPSNDSILIDRGTGVDLSRYLDNTDQQTLTITPDSLSISGGNAVPLNQFAPPSGTLNFNDAAFYEQQELTGVDGQRGSTNWIDRTINTTVYQQGNSISRSGDTITLEPGRYWVRAKSLNYRTDHTQLRLLNLNSGNAEKYGTSTMVWWLVTGGASSGDTQLETVLDISTRTRYVIQQKSSYGGAGQIGTYGVHSSRGPYEVYLMASFIKINP